MAAIGAGEDKEGARGQVRAIWREDKGNECVARAQMMLFGPRYVFLLCFVIY
jgi:hypothetical protein